MPIGGSTGNETRKAVWFVELEAGRNVAGKLGVFIRPGIGIWGQDLPGAYTLEC